jgi:molybdopterin synthase catalytic subunit
MARIAVQTQDFDVSAELAALTAGRSDIGGIASFIGTVRGHAHGAAITAMTLEHYPGMTEASLRRIAAAADARWRLLGCTLIHRVGTLLPGDNIVLVLTASAHRGDALQACEFLIDWLKTDAPFWKKERFATGEERWVEARESDDAAVARWGALTAS